VRSIACSTFSGNITLTRTALGCCNGASTRNLVGVRELPVASRCRDVPPAGPFERADDDTAIHEHNIHTHISCVRRFDSLSGARPFRPRPPRSSPRKPVQSAGRPMPPMFPEAANGAIVCPDGAPLAKSSEHFA
jgi:hypothetical protein